MSVDLDPHLLQLQLEEAERPFGPLTLLVNNAGIASGKRILDTAVDEWEALDRALGPALPRP